MHINHYFLAQLVKELTPLLVDAWLLEIFSQEKDEIVLAFAKEGKDLYVKCNLGPRFQSLSFSEEYRRAKKNTIDLFPLALEKQVMGLFVTPNDRSWGILLEGELVLFFKMHGSKSNIILYEQGNGKDQFHKSYPDMEAHWTSYARVKDFSMELLKKSKFDFQQLLPALGSEPIRWLKKQGFETASEDEKEELVCQLLERLHEPEEFYVCDTSGNAFLSFFPEDKVLVSLPTALDASNAFVKLYYSFTLKNKREEVLRKALVEKKQKLGNYIAQQEKRLQEILGPNVFEQTADVLMANLAAIPKNADRVTLFDFYSNSYREIKLKKDLSPQKNAEEYYRKSKNIGLEIANLTKNIQHKKEELEKLTQSLESEVENIPDNRVATQKGSAPESIPYKKFMFDGFEIRVGKSAQKNDEMLQQHSHKNDLWLHARGMAGSHVLIKAQSGKPFPNKVIEKAASLAAWYSKGKNDSLCPVIVTERKYVRKAKGMTPGQVIVEKERTVMVTPSEF